MIDDLWYKNAIFYSGEKAMQQSLQKPTCCLRPTWSILAATANACR